MEKQHSIIAASVALMTIDIAQSLILLLNLLPFNPMKSVCSLAKESGNFLKFCQCANVSSLTVFNETFKLLV